MSEVTSRRRFILSAVQELRDAHEEWAESDLPQISQRLWDGCETVCDALTAGDIPGDLRKLADAGGKLATQWERYQSDVAQHGPHAPGDGFWKAMDNVYKYSLAAEAGPPQRHLESIVDLQKQGLSPRQICKIYGWVDGRGQAETWRLEEEIKQPGTHVNDSFVHPALREERARAEREQQAIARLQARSQTKSVQPTDSLEELPSLVSQGLSARQIGKMVKLAPGDVQSVCVERGLPVPPMDYDPLESAAGAHDKPMPEATRRALEAAAANPVHAPAARKSAKAEKPSAKRGQSKRPRALTSRQRDTVRKYAAEGMIPEQIAQKVRGASLSAILKEVEAWEQEVGAAEVGASDDGP